MRKGIDLLDAAVPDWRERICLDTFDLSVMDRCILGQIFGDYNTGKLELGILEGASHGFDIYMTPIEWFEDIEPYWVNYLLTGALPE